MYQFCHTFFCTEEETPISSYLLILFFCPGSFHQFWVEHLLPAVLTLAICPPLWQSHTSEHKYMTVRTTSDPSTKIWHRSNYTSNPYTCLGGLCYILTEKKLAINFHESVPCCSTSFFSFSSWNKCTKQRRDKCVRFLLSAFKCQLLFLWVRCLYKKPTSSRDHFTLHRIFLSLFFSLLSVSGECSSSSSSLLKNTVGRERKIRVYSFYQHQ